MSARNTLAAKKQRRHVRGERHWRAESLTSKLVMHGICRGGCNRRRQLWLPAMLCSRCLMAAAWWVKLRQAVEASRG